MKKQQSAGLMSIGIFTLTVSFVGIHDAQADYLRGSDVLTISSDTSLASLIVEDPVTLGSLAASVATLNFQYTGTPLLLDINSFTTYVDSNLRTSLNASEGPSLDAYTGLDWGLNRTYYTSKRSESNLLNITVDPALLGSATGVRMTATSINGVNTSTLSPSAAPQIIDQVVLNGKEFVVYDVDGSDGSYGFVSATTQNSLTGAQSGADNVFLTANENLAGAKTVNSLAMDSGVTLGLGGDLVLESGRLLFSDNGSINGNISTGASKNDTYVYVTGAGNNLNGQILANTGTRNNLTIDGGDGLVAGLNINAQQTVNEVNLAQINLGLTVDNVFQGADVYWMPQNGWSGFDSSAANGSLNIGSTYQNVNNLVTPRYGVLRLYGNGVIHAQDRIAFAAGPDPVQATLISENEMNLAIGQFEGDLSAPNLTLRGSTVYGDIVDGTTATNVTVEYVELSGAKSYSGTTTVGKNDRILGREPLMTEFGGANSLDFINDGAITNSTDMKIWSGVGVSQDDANGVNNIDRLNDSMSIGFEGAGRLSLNGSNFSGDAFERVGNISTANGSGKLEAYSGANGTATLSVGNIEANNGNLLMVETDAGGRVLADSIDGDSSDRLLKSVFTTAGYVSIPVNAGATDTTTIDLPGFAEYVQGEIVAAQVDNIDINAATSTQLVRIDQSADGVLTADRSVRGMILGAATGDSVVLSGTGKLTVGEGGMIFWPSTDYYYTNSSYIGIDTDVEIINGGMLRTILADRGVQFNGVTTGALLDVAGPGAIQFNSSNDFSALNQRGGRVINFNSSSNTATVNVAAGSSLENATLGDANVGGFGGTLTIAGSADISIVDAYRSFGGILYNSGTTTLRAAGLGGYIRNTAGSTSLFVDELFSGRIQSDSGSVQIGGLSSNSILVSGTDAVLRTGGDGSIVVTSNMTVDSAASMSINNDGYRVDINGVLQNSGNITVNQLYNEYYYIRDGGINWNLNNSGYVSLQGKMYGSMTNTSTGRIIMNGRNMGLIDNTAGGQLDIVSLLNEGQVNTTAISVNANVYNYGSIAVNGSYTQDGGALDNYSQFSADSMLINGGFVGARGTIQTDTGFLRGTFQVANDVVVQNTARLQINGDLSATNVVLNTGAALSGKGNITANLSNSGQVEPGEWPGALGTLTINGDYTQNADGVLLIEIGGLLDGQYDVLDIAGTASLGGTLDVSLSDPGTGVFAPALNDSFDILSAESILGDFDSFLLASLGNGLAWQLDLFADEIGTTDVLRLSVVSAVPVPAAVWLFGSGLLALLGLGRRRKLA